MRTASGLAIVGLVALAAYGAGLGLKPGLWEVRIVKEVVDGRDQTAQMAAMSDKMRQALASMPPERRAQMQAMLGQNGVGAADRGYRICITPAMAKRDTPMVDRDGRCQPATVNHSGNRTTFEFSCTKDGVTTTGKGAATVDGDVIATHVDLSSRDSSGKTKEIQSDTQMTFVGSDCGDVKPPPGQS